MDHLFASCDCKEFSFKRALTIVRYCNKALLSIDDESALIHEICRIAVEDAGYHLAWVGFCDPHSLDKRITPIGWYGSNSTYLQLATISWGDDDLGNGPTGIATKTGRPCAFQNLSTDPAYLPWRDLARKHGFASSCAFPLFDNDVIGALSMYAAEPDAFDCVEMELLSILAENISFGLQVLRKRMQQARVEREREETMIRYRAFVENAGDAIYVSDSYGNLLDVNHEAMRQTHYSRSELLGLRVTDIDADYDRNTLGKALVDISQQERKTFQSRHKRKDGSIFPVEIRVVPIRVNGEIFFMGIVRDVTERNQMQDALIQTEKMMSIGGLAAGMAHEINNPLGGILQNTQVILRRLTKDMLVNTNAAHATGCSFTAIAQFMENRGILSGLQAIKESGERAAGVVRDMLEFSRQNDLLKTHVDINELLDKAVSLCATEYDIKTHYDFKNITIERHYAEHLPLVYCSKSQIQQVLINLLSNAAHALTDTSSPKITLRTEMDDNALRIDIADNGPGIDDTIRRRIFEPFYTTKPIGEGTGLGLSVSYYIISNNHNGSLKVESSPGHGARFTIRLSLQ